MISPLAHGSRLSPLRTGRVVVVDKGGRMFVQRVVGQVHASRAHVLPRRFLVPLLLLLLLPINSLIDPPHPAPHRCTHRLETKKMHTQVWGLVFSPNSYP